MDVVICADDSIKNIADYRIERIKAAKPQEEVKDTAEKEENKERNNRKQREQNRREERKARETVKEEVVEEKTEAEFAAQGSSENEAASTEAEQEAEVRDNGNRPSGRRRDRRNRFDRRNRNRDRNNRRNRDAGRYDAAEQDNAEPKKEKAKLLSCITAMKILNLRQQLPDAVADNAEPKGKATWWRKLIKKLSHIRQRILLRLIISFMLILAFLPFDAFAQISIISDEETEQYLASVIRPLFQQAGVPFNRNKIYIVNDNSLNAFCRWW